MASLTIGRREFEYEIEMVNIVDLKFYAKNPRVYSALNIDEDEDPDQETIFNYMKADDHVKELKQSIENNGGVLVPLIVYNSIVFEGNSRLAACKILNGVNPSKWGQVKCQVIKADIDEDAIFVLLGTYHINGRKDWQPMEQAGYLYRRTKESKKNIEAIARELSMKPSEAKTLLSVYEMMKNNNEPDASKWSYYFEMYRFKKHIDKFEEKHDINLQERLLDNIKAGEIENAQDLRSIGKIVKSSAMDASSLLDEYLSGEITIAEAVAGIAVAEDNKFVKKIETFRDMLNSDEFKDYFEQNKTQELIYELLKVSKAIYKFTNKK